MRYHHRFQVRSPVEVVSAFHSRSAAMAAITPPPLIVQIHDAPQVLGEGDEMAFSLWLGPLPLRWRARIEDVTSSGFVDRQVQGPMGHWQHRHTFVPVDDATTQVVDEVELAVRRHPIWGPVGMGMALGLPILFAYRAWRTRQLLARWEELQQGYVLPNNNALSAGIIALAGIMALGLLRTLFLRRGGPG